MVQGFRRENIRPGAASTPDNVLFCVVFETKSLLNYAFLQAEAPTRRAVAEKRTIPLVFALLRPHCCVVSSLYAAPLFSPADD